MDIFSFLCYNNTKGGITVNNFEEKVFAEFGNEIKLYYCGKRNKNFSHKHGPYNNNKYLMYFIKEGKATLTLKNKNNMILSKGFFVNFPESYNSYYCDEDTPWTIKWIMADGVMIEKYLSLLGITRDNPFIELKEYNKIELVFDEMYEEFDKKDLSSRIYCISLVHKLFSILAEEINNSKASYSEYTSVAIKLIQENYTNPEFNVAAIAEILGLHHNYFSVLYKKETGISPLKAITDYRLTNACKMLRFTDMLIKEIANVNGYSDEFYFSRIFKKTFGISPDAYRKKNISE